MCHSMDVPGKLRNTKVKSLDVPLHALPLGNNYTGGLSIGQISVKTTVYFSSNNGREWCIYSEFHHSRSISQL
jgi:hypothetical protein